MRRIQSNSDTDTVTIALIEKNILRHTIQIFYKTSEGLRPYASGVLVRLHDVSFILTASHVAEYLEGDETLYIRVDRQKYINLLGEIKYTDISKSKGVVDLAYIKIDAQLIEPLSKPFTFLNIEKFRKHNKTLDAANYCVLGFPTKNIRTDKGFMDTGASFYMTSAMNDNPYNYYKLSKEDHIVVLMKGKGTDIQTGKKADISAEFYGISGGGLWLVLYILDPISGKHTATYHLVGIMTKFFKGKYYCMVANKIHLCLEAIEAMEKLKFREIPVRNII